MKNIFFIILAFVLLNSCKKEKVIVIENSPKITKGYAIKGNFKTVKPVEVYLQKQDVDKKFKTVQTIMVKDNIFHFNGDVTTDDVYYISFSDVQEKIPVLINNFESFINVNISDINKSTIQGSPIQVKYTAYLDGLDKAKNKFHYKLSYIKKNSNSSISTIVLKQMLGKTKWRLEQNRKAYNYLSDDLKKSILGHEIDAFILKNAPKVAKQESIAELSLDPKVSDAVPLKIIQKKSKAVIAPYRKKAPNFSAESLSGSDISLNSIIKKNKVVLIDFWASWCGPCRNQNPHLKQLYRKYHSKGFEVIGVSEDEYSDMYKWKNAISNDQLPWIQLIDDNKRVARMFGVKGIPHTVLLDARRGIILNKKSSFTIEAELKKIFGF